MKPYKNSSGQGNSSSQKDLSSHIPGTENNLPGEEQFVIKEAVFPSSPMSATVVIFVIAGVLLLLFTKFDHTQSLISYYDEKEDFSQVLPQSVTGTITAASASLSTARNHTKTLHYLYKQLISSPQNDTLHYYIGVCYVEAQDPVNAIRSFKKVIRNRQSGLKQKAEYKLGLAYLHAEDIEQAKSVFEKIAKQSHHTYREKAARILKEKQLF